MLLRIKAGLRRVWRTTDTVQIGLSQRRGTVLAGLIADDLPLLERLHEGIDDAAPEVAGDGADNARRRELIRLLTEAEVLVGFGTGSPTRDRLGAAGDRLSPDAAIWSVVHSQVGDGWGLLAARTARHVLIAGAGRLGSTLAATLAAAGVGRLTVSDPRRVTAADLAPGGASSPDLGNRREEAALDAVRRFGGQGGRISSVPERWAESRPDLVVLIQHGAADASTAGQLLSADLPHLSVVIREDDVLVGPLVRPGSGPCLRCLDLHRGDRDPAWPSVLAQLLGPSSTGPEPEETALSTLAAGLVALQVLAQLDGVSEPATVGATLEIELPDGLIARRSWPAHPRCGCHWPPRSDGATDQPQGVSPADARGTRLAERMVL